MLKKCPACRAACNPRSELRECDDCGYVFSLEKRRVGPSWTLFSFWNTRREEPAVKRDSREMMLATDHRRGVWGTMKHIGERIVPGLFTWKSSKRIETSMQISNSGLKSTAPASSGQLSQSEIRESALPGADVVSPIDQMMDGEVVSATAVQPSSNESVVPQCRRLGMVHEDGPKHVSSPCHGDNHSEVSEIALVDAQEYALSLVEADPEAPLVTSRTAPATTNCEQTPGGWSTIFADQSSSEQGLAPPSLRSRSTPTQRSHRRPEQPLMLNPPIMTTTRDARWAARVGVAEAQGSQTVGRPWTSQVAERETLPSVSLSHHHNRRHGRYRHG